MKKESRNNYLPNFENEPTVPKTGDTSDISLWIALLLIIGGAAA